MFDENKLSFKKKMILWVVNYFGWLLIHLIRITLRFEIKGWEHIETCKENEQSYMMLVWHGRSLMPMMICQKENIYIMVSEHFDGELITRVLKKIGYGIIRGSSRRGGTKALREMVRKTKFGGNGAITPDGPRGPRRELKMGPIAIAQVANIPIIPIGAAAKRAFIFKSWDRLMIPKFFSRTAVYFGEPIWVNRNMDPNEGELIRREIEKKIIQLDDQAEKELGVEWG